MLAQRPRRHEAGQRGAQRDARPARQPPHGDEHEQRRRRLAERHEDADRRGRVAQRQRARAEQVQRRRLGAGEVAVQRVAVEQLARAERVDAVGVLPVALALPRGERGERRGGEHEPGDEQPAARPRRRRHRAPTRKRVARKLPSGRGPSRTTRESTNSALRSRPPGVMSAESHVSFARRRVPVVDVDARDLRVARHDLVEDEARHVAGVARALGDVRRAVVVAPHEAAGLRQPDLGVARRAQQLAQARRPEAVGLDVVVQAPQARREAQPARELLAPTAPSRACRASRGRGSCRSGIRGAARGSRRRRSSAGDRAARRSGWPRSRSRTSSPTDRARAGGETRSAGAPATAARAGWRRASA